MVLGPVMPALLTRMLIDNRGSAAFAHKRLNLDPTLSEAEKTELRTIVANGAPRTLVILDEAQNFLASNISGPVREEFIQLVKEGRNMGLSALIATQQPSAIDQRILSQVGTFITHQLVTEPDIRAVRENFQSDLPEKIEFGKNELDISGLLRRLEPGQCLISASDMNTTTRRVLVATIRPRATVHGGIEL